MTAAKKNTAKKARNANASNAPADGAPKEKKKRGPRTKGLMNYQAAQLSLLIDGFPAIQQKYSEGLVTRPTLKRALVDLKQKGRTGENVTLFEGWVAEMTSTGDRGRKPLTPGQSRRYKAQALKVKNKDGVVQEGDGAVFLRAPLGAIGVKKGEDVIVEISADGLSMTLRKATSADAPAAAEAAAA